ncbi:MAG: Major facilitator superfamily MFS_1 [Leptospirillum sp. Group IV 'UBA BS']|nr:MAG: Major facilitator superfamily MFS_1 [Leptospirillum sp. Group IV 'UBA BS']
MIVSFSLPFFPSLPLPSVFPIPLWEPLGSSFTLSYLLAAPLAGFLSDRIHPRRVLAGGVLVFSAGMWICAMADGVAGLFLGRSLTGVGEAALFVVGPQSIGTEKGSAWKLAVFLSAMPLGGAAGFVAATHATVATFRHILMLPVFPGLLLGLILLAVSFPFPDKETAPLHPRNVAALFRRDRSLISLVIVEGTNVFVLGGMAVWISLYLTREKHIDVGAGKRNDRDGSCHGRPGPESFFPVFCVIVCRQGVSVLSSSFSREAQALSLAGIFVVLATSGKTILFAGLLLASIGLFGTNVPILVALLRKSPPVMWGSVLGGVLFVAHLFGDLPSATVIGLSASKIGLSRSLDLLLPRAGHDRPAGDMGCSQGGGKESNPLIFDVDRTMLEPCQSVVRGKPVSGDLIGQIGQ